LGCLTIDLTMQFADLAVCIRWGELVRGDGEGSFYWTYEILELN